MLPPLALLDSLAALQEVEGFDRLDNVAGERPDFGFERPGPGVELFARADTAVERQVELLPDPPASRVEEDEGSGDEQDGESGIDGLEGGPGQPIEGRPEQFLLLALRARDGVEA